MGQKLIHQYRDALARSKFVVKDGGALGTTYWLAMMRDWAQNLQTAFDEAHKKGDITSQKLVCFQQNGNDTPEFRASADAIMAYKLLINVGDKIDLSRAGTTRLVDAQGTINPESFYNVLTLWYHDDSITYTVTQANLYPLPRPEWIYAQGFCNNISDAELKSTVV